MYYDKDQIKELLTMENTFNIIEILGGEPVYTKFGFMSDTICHNELGFGSKKLYFYENTKLFHCYTECGSMDILEVICKTKNIQTSDTWTLYKAMDFVVNLFSFAVENNSLENENNNLRNDLKILNNYTTISKIKENIELEYKLYDDNILNHLSFIAPKPWLDEGITIETMKRYNIKYYGTDHKIIIPHYNLNNELIGIRGRALIEEDIEVYGKYMPVRINNIMYTHPLSYNLYGLNLNLKNIRQMKKIIVFEGEKSVLLYDSFFGGDNNISVATCGSSLSLIQQEIIKNICNVDEIIIAYDKEFQKIGDVNFTKSIAALQNIANKLNNYCNVSLIFDKFDLLGYKQAPIDKGKETFEFLFQNRIFI